jgi:hypothetical protein
MKTFDIKIEKTIQVTEENINDIIVTAFEGGINYWCDKASPLIIPDDASDDVLTSDIVSIGGTVQLFVAEPYHDVFCLNLSKMLNGISLYCQDNGIYDSEVLMQALDADVADSIIQYAIFEDLIFS